MLRIAALFCCFLWAVHARAEEFRTWKAASGSYSSEAKFVGLDIASKSICLTTKAGKNIRVAYSKLSTKDQNYVLEVDAKRQDAATIGTLPSLDVSPKVIEVFEKRKIPLPQRRDGLLVSEVPNGSPAAVAGLHDSDIIHAIDDIPIKTGEDYLWATRGMKVGQSYKIIVERISKASRWEETVVTVIPLPRAEVTKAIRNAPPLKLAGGVRENSIGVTVVEIGGRNLTDKAIVAFVVELQCFDRFEKPVLGSDGTKSNKVPAICQNTIKAKAAFVRDDDVLVSLSGRETATVVKIYLKKVKFDDGSEWKSDDGVYMDTATSSK